MNLKNGEELFLRQTEYSHGILQFLASIPKDVLMFYKKHQDVFGNTVQTSITFVRKNMASSAGL